MLTGNLLFSLWMIMEILNVNVSKNYFVFTRNIFLFYKILTFCFHDFEKKILLSKFYINYYKKTGYAISG